MAKIQIFWKLRQLYSTPLWLYTGKQEYLDINKKSLEAIFFPKNFVHCFLFTKRIIVFFDLFLFDCPILWQLDSTSFAVTWTSISDRMAVTASSSSSSLMLSGIPDKMRLFLWSYCSRSSIDGCRTSTLLSKQSHIACNHILSS